MANENIAPWLGAIYFREMRPDDAAAVEIVEKASFAVPWSRESFWREAMNERTTYRVAVLPTTPTNNQTDKEETIVAYAGCWVIDDEGQIMNVAVQPDYRGSGLGKRLIADLLAAAERRGAARFTLEVRPSNAVAIALYSSFGFKDCGRRPHYYADGEDAIIMWKL